MYHKTRGIVLKTIKHSETSIIAHILTEEFGRRSYMVNAARGKKSKMNFFQPLSVLELEVSERSNKNLQRIKELKFYNSFPNLRFDYIKNYISFFLAEVLHRTLVFDENDYQVFEFILASIEYLDLQQTDFSNFHIYFVIQLTQHLGLYPRNNWSDSNSFFDMLDGEFKNSGSLNAIDQKNSVYLNKFLNSSISRIHEIKMSGKDRAEFLELFLKYYTLHNYSLSNLNSLKVLRECF